MSAQETWKAIPGHDAYEVSDLGRVRSLLRDRPHVMKPRYDRHGYLYLALGANTYRKMHRLVLMTFIPNPEGKPQVNHKNGIRDDNRLQNLEWATCSENQKHAVRIGLWHSPTEKLNPANVAQIRLRIAAGAVQARLANEFAVSKYTISDIKRGKTWTRIAA